MKKVSFSIISFPVSKAFVTPLFNLADILLALSNNVNLVIATISDVTVESNRKNLKVYDLQLAETNNIFGRLIRFLKTQLKISIRLYQESKNDEFVFFFMHSGSFLPLITAKLLRKKIILILPSSIKQWTNCHNDFFDKILIHLEKISYIFAKKIILYSHALIAEWQLEPYAPKILCAHRHFVDFTLFFENKTFSSRENIVGYIGRFSKEKGVLNLVKSIPLILKHNADLRFEFYGEGRLYSEIFDFIQQENLIDNVIVNHWVSHETVAERLNDFKLLVLPSYTEGLPNSILEAMACGTPVLATCVGAVPDIIKDGKTGFLLKSSKPDDIERKIIELFDNSPQLEKVSKAANEFVRNGFNYNSTLNLWKNLLKSLDGLNKKFPK